MFKTLLVAGFVCLAIVPSVVHADDVGGTPARQAPPSEWYPAQPAPRQEMPARTSESSGSSAAARQSIDDAISHQQTRRALSITGLVIGGAVVIGGLVYAASEAQRKANSSGKDQVYVNWIGLGAGVPIIAVSIYNLANAQRQLNRLRMQRAQLGLAPRKDGVEVGLAINF